MAATPPPIPRRQDTFYHQAATCCLLAPVVATVVNIFLVSSGVSSDPSTRWLVFIPGAIGLGGVILGVISLFGIRKYGRRGILWKSTVGIGIVTFLVLALLPALFRAKEIARRRAARLQYEQHSPPGQELFSRDIEVVQADVRRTLNALYTGDVDTVLSYTHPKIVQELGGSSQATEVLKKISAQIQSAEMKMESLTFPEKPTFAKGDAHDFAIVPTKAIIAIQEKRLESLNYQFGVRETGTASWKYVEGSRITPDNVRTLFPDFPSNVALPEVSRKKL